LQIQTMEYNNLPLHSIPSLTTKPNIASESIYPESGLQLFLGGFFFSNPKR